MKSDRSLLTVTQFSDKHIAFSESTIRWLIFCSKPREFSKGAIEGNGLHDAFVRIGRRVYVNEDKFFELIDYINNNNN